MGTTKAALLAGHMKLISECATDRTRFCREFLEIEPHPGQQKWFANAWRPENAVTTGNQWGKTTSAAALLIHACIYRIGWFGAFKEEMEQRHATYRAMNIAPSMSQAQLVWNSARAMLMSPKAQILVSDIKMTPFPTIHFINGATLEARSTARDAYYILGEVLDVINWDEAAQESRFKKIIDNVVRMRLVARGGSLYITSTGNGRNDYGLYFLNGLEGRDPDLYCQTGSSFENPHLKHDRVQMNMGRMSDKMRQQNIEGAIVSAGAEYFDGDDLLAAEDNDLTGCADFTYDDEGIVERMQLYPHKHTDVATDSMRSRPWEQVYPNHRYVHAWDLADKQDWMVGITYDLDTRPKATMVEFERFHKRGWPYNYARIRDRHVRFRNERATVLDTTGIGDAVFSELQDIRPIPFIFTGARKDGMLINLQTLLANRVIRWPNIPVLYNEHAFYERKDDKLNTDCVMANGLACLLIKRSSLGSSLSIASASGMLAY